MGHRGYMFLAGFLFGIFFFDLGKANFGDCLIDAIFFFGSLYCGLTGKDE
jgi:hypothetical protein